MKQSQKVSLISAILLTYSSDGGLETRFDGSRSRQLKVSVSRFKGLTRDYSIETTRPEEEENEKIEA